MTEKGIYLTSDGSHSLYSEQFGESYHSRHGAIQESQHVFIDAGFLAKKELPRINVFEMGFGTGLNAYLTYQTALRLSLPTYYLGIEAYPLDLASASLLNYPEQLGSKDQKSVFLEMHQSSWGITHHLDPLFTFEKRKELIESIQLEPIFDVIYFDAFAPAAQPHLWELPVLSKMYEALRPGGILVTYCAKGIVKRQLKSLGFVIEALPGPVGKREMTRVIKHH